MKFSISSLCPFVPDLCVRSKLCALVLMLGFCVGPVSAQVNSGSDGHDGAFNPTQSVTIDMADHPDGIYQYTSVNIPLGVTVTFKPNARNAPVIWLVQSSCIIKGTVDLSGQSIVDSANVGLGGAGGYQGGNAGTTASAGFGPGGGPAGRYGGNASYGNAGTGFSFQSGPGTVYGNVFLLPLLGGSGGGGGGAGGYSVGGGAGGGGAILIAASNLIQIDGLINAYGGNYTTDSNGTAGGGAGSGGGIRLISQMLAGTGALNCSAGQCTIPSYGTSYAGAGRIRLDYIQNSFGGKIFGNYTQGFQPVIIPAAGQGIQLSIASVGGLAVSASPSGAIASPDLIIPGQQNNPISVVVNCSNVPLNTAITVTVHPANGSDVQATGFNNSGTTASSNATVPVNLPHGGGIIYAKCVSGVAGSNTSSANVSGAVTPSLNETGLTATGERIKSVEVTTTPGGKQQTTYVTPSGKRYPVPPQ